MHKRPRARRRRIRVLLAEMPNWMIDSVRGALGATRDMRVDSRESRHEVLLALRERGADVLIVPARSSGVPQPYRAALRWQRGLRVMTIAPDRHRADLYELRLLGTNVEFRDVVEAIRAAVTGRAS